MIQRAPEREQGGKPKVPCGLGVQMGFWYYSQQITRVLVCGGDDMIKRTSGLQRLKQDFGGPGLKRNSWGYY